jgi:phosphoribosylformylglycinamidine synthase
MCFADIDLAADYDLTRIGELDSVKMLFSENIGIVFQADSSVEETLEKSGIPFFCIGKVTAGNTISIKNGDDKFSFNVNDVRHTWFRASYLLDRKQSGEQKAKERYENFASQPLQYNFPSHFTGIKPIFHLSKPRPKAAIIREKGSNSEREMANAMYLAGFDVKDVHMTDLISGRETLEEIQFIGAVGGFSNSDVLGSAKGWAGAFLYNEKAKVALDNFFAREDTLSVGICNGCQLFMELEVINPDHEVHGKMLHNQSRKHESGFTSVKIYENNSVMLKTLAGTTLGVWISHGEGRFDLPYSEDRYDIVAKYAYDGYPANPNGSHFDIAMMCDSTGRHLVTMPHIERSTFQWNWAHYPKDRNDEVTPWLEAFVNARKWLANK